MSSFCHTSSISQLKYNLETGHFTNFGHKKIQTFGYISGFKSLASLSFQFKSWGRKRAPGFQDDSERVMQGRLADGMGASHPLFSAVDGKLSLEVGLPRYTP